MPEKGLRARTRMLQQVARGDGEKGHGRADESGNEQKLRQVVGLLGGSHPRQREQPLGVVLHQDGTPKTSVTLQQEPPQIAREFCGGSLRRRRRLARRRSRRGRSAVRRCRFRGSWRR